MLEQPRAVPPAFPRARGFRIERGKEHPRDAAPAARSLTPCPLPSCNLTCPLGHYGANCAEACSCHDGTCDPLTGACHMGECRWVRAAGPPGSSRLSLLLSCRGQPADGGDRGRGPPGAAAHPPALAALLLLRLPQEGRSPRVSVGMRAARGPGAVPWGLRGDPKWVRRCRTLAAAPEVPTASPRVFLQSLRCASIGCFVLFCFL